MMRLRIFLCMAAACGISACGDGETNPVQSDSGVLDGDAGETDEDIAPPDVDATVDADIDLREPQEDPLPPWEPLIPPTETACGDGIDEDGDGDLDCEDSDCEGTIVCRTENPEPDCGGCPEGTECVDGLWCRYPGFDLPWPDYEVWSVVTALRLADAIPAGESYAEAQVSGGEAGAVCCFDIDGDETVDNGLANLAETLEGSVIDIQGALTDLVESDSLTILARMVRGFDGTDPSQLHFFTGTNDIDGDGQPDQPFSARQSGDGVYLLDRTSTDPPAALSEFNRGTYDALTGRFVSPAERFVLTLPLESIAPGLGDTTLTVVDARLEATLDTAEPTTTVDTEFDGQLLGGARLGGYIRLDEIFGALDDIVQDSCGCAVGISTGEPPAISYGEGAGSRADRYGVACNEEEFDVAACVPGNVICDNLSFVCGTGATLINSLAISDVDTNGNGIDDSLSVGFFVSMANATIDDAVFVGGEGSGAEGSGSDGSGG